MKILASWVAMLKPGIASTIPAIISAFRIGVVTAIAIVVEAVAVSSAVAAAIAVAVLARGHISIFQASVDECVCVRVCVFVFV